MELALNSVQERIRLRLASNLGGSFFRVRRINLQALSLTTPQSMAWCNAWHAGRFLARLPSDPDTQSMPTLGGGLGLRVTVEVSLA